MSNIIKFGKYRHYHDNGMEGQIIGLPKNYLNNDLKYILGVLNSKLMTWFYQADKSQTDKTFLQLKNKLLSRAPIILLNLKDKEEKEKHDKIVNLVSQLLEVKKKIEADKAEADKKEIEDLERQINSEVYRLYELDWEEVNLVEGERVINKFIYTDESLTSFDL